MESNSDWENFRNKAFEWLTIICQTVWSGLTSIRFLIWTVTLLSVLSGLTLLIEGIWLLVESDYFLSYGYVVDTFYLLFGFMIVTGVVILITALIGYYGVKREKYDFVVAYITLLVTILIVQISISGLAYRLEDDCYSGKAVLGKLYDDIQEFIERGYERGNWDYMQKKLYCCGYSGAKDFVRTMSSKIPLSCCGIDSWARLPFECTADIAHYYGCSNRLRYGLSMYAYFIGITAASLAGVQGIIIVFAACLAYRLKSKQDVSRGGLLDPSENQSPKANYFSQYHIIPGQTTCEPRTNDIN